MLNFEKTHNKWWLLTTNILKAADLKDQELKIEIAVMLFEQERLSLRKAAELAGLHWLDFMKLLNRREIPLHYDESLL